MKLVMLGTTGYHPNDIRQTACYALPEIGVVLDAGTGMFRLREHIATRGGYRSPALILLPLEPAQVGRGDRER